MRIRSVTTEQQGSDYVYSIVNRTMTGHGPRIIGDSVAVTIAAWWQSSGYTGKAFAELASTGSADSEELIFSIQYAFGEADNELDRKALLLLLVWVTRDMC